MEDDSKGRAYVRLDKEKLTAHQRKLWDDAKMDEPPPRPLSQRNVDERFRYVCEVAGDPIKNQ